MKFDDITFDGRLWAVRYDGDPENILELTFNQWNNIDFLKGFFKEHMSDLESYFHISSVDLAINDTLADAEQLECLIFDLNPGTDFDEIFRPLDNLQASEIMLSKEKAKGNRISGHDSWLRLYAIRIESHSYLITGGAIKLTLHMSDRAHTEMELQKLDMVKRYLLDNAVTDSDSFKDFIITKENDTDN